MTTKRIQALEGRRDEIHRELETLDDLVIERGSGLTDEEQTTYDALNAERVTVDSELPPLIQRENDIAASRALSASLGKATNRNDGKIERTGDVGGEGDPIYRADEGGFFLDIYRSRIGRDLQADARLNDHQNEMARAGRIERAATSGALAGIVVPQYATSAADIVGLAREGRPFLNTLNARPITGMSVILPRIVTSPVTAAQTAENVAFANADVDTEEVTVATKTVGGYTDISVQALEFGAIDETWLMGELLLDLYTRMDYLGLHGTGANGQPEGLFASDGTNVVDADSVTSFAEHFAAFMEAAKAIQVNDFRIPTHGLMSAGRWYSLMSALDSDGRPLMGINGSMPQNVGGRADGLPMFAGLSQVVDQNVVMATEDDTFAAVYNAPSIWFAESPTTKLVCDCVLGHTGTVRFILRAYMQFSAEIRPLSTTIIQDLAPPTDFPMLAVS